MGIHCNLLLKIETTAPNRTQEMYITIGHIFIGMLEHRLGLV